MGNLNGLIRLQTVSFEHGPIPGQIIGHRDSQEVPVAYLEHLAAQHLSSGPRSHHGSKTVFLHKPSHHFGGTRCVSVDQQHSPTVELLRS